MYLFIYELLLEPSICVTSNHLSLMQCRSWYMNDISIKRVLEEGFNANHPFVEI